MRYKKKRIIGQVKSPSKRKKASEEGEKEVPEGRIKQIMERKKLKKHRKKEDKEAPESERKKEGNMG